MENMNISKDKFRFADPSRRTGDKKFDTKQTTYTKDVFHRFCKNKSSVIAAFIIVILVLFAIIVPMFCETNYSLSLTDTAYLKYAKLLPKCSAFEGTGFWDGTKTVSINENEYNAIKAIEKETGETIITQVIKDKYLSAGKSMYDVRIDTYLYSSATTANTMFFLDVSKEEFEAMQAWQSKEGNPQLIYPAVNKNLKGSDGKTLIAERFNEDPDIWYATDMSGNPKLVGGKLTPSYASTNQSAFQGIRYSEQYYSYNSKRIDGDDGSLIYALVSVSEGQTSYRVRVCSNTYFEYHFGHEAAFLCGTNERGQDILTRLAAGARFSLVLAVCISAVNLFIGAIYGAVEGFYGGAVDLVMERISDVLGGMPTMVVMSLFQLHLASKVGPVWSMAFAFILTGWLGMAARTRMQFYRFKHQEYVLSARTLGASDSRLIFKHIFPNAMGTLITGSVLSIPGVIFSESSLTYLGIVNLESSTETSVGTLLSNGNGLLATYPHIILFPAIFISLLEISFNLFGNGLRDAFNPSLKGIED